MILHIIVPYNCCLLVSLKFIIHECGLNFLTLSGARTTDSLLQKGSKKDGGRYEKHHERAGLSQNSPQTVARQLL